MSKECKYVIKGRDLAYLGEATIDSEELKCVMSYFIGQKEAEISLSPTIVLPLFTSQQNYTGYGHYSI